MPDTLSINVKRPDGSVERRDIELQPGQDLVVGPDGRLKVGGSTADPVTQLDATLADIANNTVEVTGPAQCVTTDNKLVYLPIGVTAGTSGDNTQFEEGVTASDFGQQLISQPSKRFAQDLLSVPLPFAAFTHTLARDEWRKAAKFTSTKSTAVSGTAKSSTGYVKCLDHDGTWEAVVGTGNANSNISLNFTASGDNQPRFYAIIPCDAAGNLSGDLTHLALSSNQLTSFDGTGLGSLTDLYLFSNQLTSFDGTGLGSLTDLYLSSNQLISFDGTGLSSLAYFGLDNNQLTSFDGTGLVSLEQLIIVNNQLISFDGTDLGSLGSLYIQGNQLESVLLPDFTGTQPYTWTTYALDLSNQNMTTDAVYEMLNSIPAPATDQPYPIDLTGNPCDDTVTSGPNLVDGATYTAAQVEALLTAKGYELVVDGGTITG